MCDSSWNRPVNSTPGTAAASERVPRDDQRVDCPELDSARQQDAERDTMSRRLLLFGVTQLTHMLEKGNVWYVRHYESYFDEVHVAYLTGYWSDTVSRGRTRLISCGRKNGRMWLDLLLAPIQLLRVANRVQPTSYLTADVVFSWWTASLIKLLRRARVVLMPVSIPEEIYASTGQSLSGIPIWMERLFLKMSCTVADSIILSENATAQIKWLEADPRSVKKLRFVAGTVEEYPPRTFYEGKDKLGKRKEPNSGAAQLLYVGRLHPEKLTLSLIDTMRQLKDEGVDVRLVIAGDGPERAEMEQRAKDLEISDQIVWLGFVQAEQLPELYHQADLFISTVSGTSLREAGLWGLPIVGYDADWVRELLVHEDTALLAGSGDSKGLARQIARALADDDLSARVAGNFHRLASSKWKRARIVEGLRVSFEQDTQ